MGEIEDSHQFLDAGYSACINRISCLEALRRQLHTLSSDTLDPQSNAGMGSDHQMISRFRGSRLLVVDDIPYNLTVISKFLENMGIEVETASGGEEALERVTTEPYDLVLMDCKMPGMDGNETTRRIRKFEQALGKPAIPIIAYTANVRKSDEDSCIASGMNGIIHKPIRRVALESVMQKWLPKSPNERSL